MQHMGVQHKGGMYNMKRVIALLLTLVMLLGLVPTALAAEAAAPDGTVLKAAASGWTPWRRTTLRRKPPSPPDISPMIW